MAATADSRSLLSRIAPSVSKEALPQSTVLAKRIASESTDERPTKRRHNHDTCFAPWLKEDNAPYIEADFEERLHHELSRFVEYISPSKQELEARNILVERIKLLLKTRWHDTQVTVFGSSVTGLGLTGGDIDLVVSFDNVNSLSDTERRRRLSTMGNILRSSGMTHWVNRILNAKVPIIAFVTSDSLGEVEFDISIRNGEDDGIRAIPLVKQYLADMPALRPLTLAVKAFLSLRNLNDASQGTLSSYAITLLCINFLQRNSYGRSQEQLNPRTAKTLGLLLMDFYRYYGHDFPYETHYASVSQGDIFPKELKNWEIKRSNRAVLAVQCIVNPDSNITRGCSKIALVIDAFREALGALESASTTPSQTGSSVLCQIFEISEEDDAKRHFLDESVRSGAFLRSAASCSAGVDTRVVGGGVPLGRNDQRKNNPIGNGSSLLTRLESGSKRTYGNEGAFDRRSKNGFTPHGAQPLPIRDWRDDRRQQQPVPYFPTAPFEIQAQSWHSQGHPASTGRIDPSSLQQRIFTSLGTHNNNAMQNGSRTNFTGRSYNGRR